MHRSRVLAQRVVQSQSWCTLKKNLACGSALGGNSLFPYREKKTSSRNPSDFKSSGSGGVSHLFVPVPVKATNEDTSVGVELAGRLNKQDVLQVLNKFFRRSEVKLLSAEHGLDSKFL